MLDRPTDLQSHIALSLSCKDSLGTSPSSGPLGLQQSPALKGLSQIMRVLDTLEEHSTWQSAKHYQGGALSMRAIASIFKPRGRFRPDVFEDIQSGEFAGKRLRWSIVTAVALVGGGTALAQQPARQEPPKSSTNGSEDGLNETELEERFGEQEFWPEGGFVVRPGQRLPVLVWELPDLVAKVVDDPTIPTRWFNDRFEEVKTAHKPGRYYAYGEAPAPRGPCFAER